MSDLLKFYHAPAFEHPAKGVLFRDAREYADMFDEIASLIGLPNDGRLFGETQLIARCLIKAWRQEKNVIFDWSILDRMYADAQNSTDKKSTWGTRRESPVYAFVLSYYEIGQSNGVPPQHIALLPYLLKRIWKCYSQVDYPTDDYLYHLCLVAKKLLATAPTFPSVSRFDWLYTERLAIAKCVISCVLDDDIGLTTDPDWTYINDLLFRDRNRLGQGGGGHGGAHQMRWLLLERRPTAFAVIDNPRYLDFKDYFSEDDGVKPDVRGKVHSSAYIPSSMDYQAMVEAGEFKVDYVDDYGFSFPAHWFDDPWKAKRKERGKIEAMVFAERTYPWDVACLFLRTIRVILDKIIRGDMESAVLAMTLFMGMSESDIKRLKFGVISEDEYSDGHNPEQLLHGDRFYDPTKKEMWWINELGFEDEAIYLCVPLIVRLNLPPALAEIMPVQESSNLQLFSASELRNAKKYLKELEKDGVSSPSLSRLRKTFEAYFVNAAGLPEIFADHLRGGKRTYLMSQHHYISLDWHHHVEQWHHMVGRFFAYDEEKISQLINDMLFRTPDPASELKQQLHVGAIHTPSKTALIKHFSALYGDLPDNMGSVLASVDQWNSFVTYLYYMMAGCTGRRPQRDPFPNLRNFDLLNGCFFIDDKHNKSFKESRVVPLCPTLNKSLNIYSRLDAKQRTRMKLRAFSDDTSVGEPFLIDVQFKQLIQVSPASCDRLVGTRLQTDGYCMGLRNGLRHLLLSRLQQVGITSEWIDSISGHRHMGREMEMSSSMANWLTTANKLQEIIETEIVVSLGLKVPFDGN